MKGNTAIVKDQQGVTANKNGKAVENEVLNSYIRKGFKVFTYAELKKNPEKCVNIEKYVMKNVPYNSVYSSTGRTEFVSVDKGEATRIEVKTQQRPGSVDEKMEFLMNNAIEKFPEKHVIIVMEGNGFKKGCRSRMKRRASHCRKKEIKVVNLNEFNLLLDSIYPDEIQIAI